MSIEQALIERSRAYMLRARTRQIGQLEWSKGCDPHLADYPLALEPLYERMVEPERRAARGGLGPWTSEAHGFLADDLFYRVKVRVASAIDARMAGIAKPVMTSGGSGNQGAVAILTPYLVGREMDVPAEKIIQSIAVAHAMNAYVKAFVGELSVICGCAMAAAISSAAAIVYQQAGADLRKINLAVNSVVGDLGGLICDGAKPSCSMKAITGVDAALRSALMALQGYGLRADEGVVGQTAEQSIRNLARLSLEGMFPVDPTVLRIIQERAGRSGLG